MLLLLLLLAAVQLRARVQSSVVVVRLVRRSQSLQLHKRNSRHAQSSIRKQKRHKRLKKKRRNYILLVLFVRWCVIACVRAMQLAR